MLIEGNKLTLFGIQIVASLIMLVALMWAAIYLIVTGQPLADDIRREFAEQTVS